MASKASAKPIVRHANAEDVYIILDLIRALALYELAPDSVLATEDSLRNSLSFPPFPSPGYARTLLIFTPEPESKPAGMALYFHNYSTWRAKAGIYLEDLFVRPEYRGRGYGGRLLAELAREVVDIDGGRLDWSVLTWNEPSIKFYKSIGAQPMDGWMGMRLDNAALEKVAKKAQGLDDPKPS